MYNPSRRHSGLDMLSPTPTNEHTPRPHGRADQHNPPVRQTGEAHPPPAPGSGAVGAEAVDDDVNPVEPPSVKPGYFQSGGTPRISLIGYETAHAA